MKIKYWLNFGNEENPEMVEIQKSESHPKTRAKDKALHKKYGMKNSDYDKKYPKEP